MNIGGGEAADQLVRMMLTAQRQPFGYLARP